MSTSQKVPSHIISQLSSIIENPYRSQSKWDYVLQWAKTLSTDPDLVSKIYSVAIQFYPNNGDIWYHYIKHIINTDRTAAAAMFEKCLDSCFHIPLWELYLTFLKENIDIELESFTKNLRDEAKLSKVAPLTATLLDQIDSRKISLKSDYRQALDDATKKLTYHMDSIKIWELLIDNLKNEPSSNEYQRGQQMKALREAYQTIVQSPVNKINEYWTTYKNYERNLSVALAAELLGRFSPIYESRSNVYSIRSTIYEGLDTKIKPCPLSYTWPKDPKKYFIKNQSTDDISKSTMNHFTTLSDKFDQFYSSIWHCLEYEYSNPMGLNEDPYVQVLTFCSTWSIQFAQFNPEFWLRVGNFFSSFKSRSQWFEQGLKSCPNSLMLSFSVSEWYELVGKRKRADEIFQQLLSLPLYDAQFDSIDTEDDPEIDTKSETTNEDPSIWEIFCSLRPISPSLSLSERTLVIICYLRFIARTQGKSKLLSTFIKKFRSDPATDHHVYIAVAEVLRKFFHDNTSAEKVLRAGLKKIGSSSNIPYTLYWLDFLVSQNQIHNIRVLLEELVSSWPKDIVHIAWNKFLAFERSSGDLASIHALEKRFSIAFPLPSYRYPSNPPSDTQPSDIQRSFTDIPLILDRYRFLDLNSTLKDHTSSILRGYRPLTDTKQNLSQYVTSLKHRQSALMETNLPSVRGKRSRDQETSDKFPSTSFFDSTTTTGISSSFSHLSNIPARRGTLSELGEISTSSESSIDAPSINEPDFVAQVRKKFVQIKFDQLEQMNPLQLVRLPQNQSISLPPHLKTLLSNIPSGESMKYYPILDSDINALVKHLESS